MDCIRIKQLRLNAYVGIHPWEKQIKQPLYIDLNLYYDFQNSHDDLVKVIDYSKICELINCFIETRHFNLIETVAEAILSILKDKYFIKKAKITVSKPFAVKNAANISISITKLFE